MSNSQKAILCIVSLYTIGMLVTVIGYVFYTKYQTVSRQYAVMQACYRSFNTKNLVLQKRCGDLQTQYNMEFICDSNDAYALCQTEIK